MRFPSRLVSSLIVLSLTALPAISAGTPPLLEQAAEKWMGERDNWAFTMLVREFDGGRVKEERRERYDPSKPGMGRWTLLLINGQPPTDVQLGEWQKRKSKKRKKPGKPLNEYLEFAHAEVIKESDTSVCYSVPLRDNHSWLFPVEKVSLRVTVNKKTLAIEDVVAGIDEPFKVALGLARVMNVDFDLQMNSPEQGGDTSNPAAAKPDGTARAVVNKLGERVEYEWSNFQRVTPHPDNVIAESPPKGRAGE